jgi:hypothetical protein
MAADGPNRTLQGNTQTAFVNVFDFGHAATAEFRDGLPCPQPVCAGHIHIAGALTKRGRIETAARDSGKQQKTRTGSDHPVRRRPRQQSQEHPERPELHDPIHHQGP